MSDCPRAEYGPSDAVEYEPSVGSHGSGSGRMGGADLGYPATSHGGSFAGAGAMSGGSGLNTLTSLAQGPTPYLPASSQLSLGAWRRGGAVLRLVCIARLLYAARLLLWGP